MGLILTRIKQVLLSKKALKPAPPPPRLTPPTNGPARPGL